MSLRTLPAPALTLSPLRTAGFLLGGIAVAIVITGCSSAEPEKSETEKQVSSAAVVSSESQKAAVDSTVPTTAKTVPVPKTAMSPKETSIKMMAEVENIKTYAELEAFFLKYSTKAQVADFTKKDFYPLSEAEKKQTISLYKALWQLSSDMTIIQESINGSTATLSFSNKSGASKLTISLVLENNQWKLEGVTWKHPY